MHEMQEKQEVKAKEALKEFQSILVGKEVPPEMQETDAEKEETHHSCCEEDPDEVVVLGKRKH